MRLFRYTKNLVTQESSKVEVCERCHFRIIGKRNSCSTCGAYFTSKDNLPQKIEFSDNPPLLNACVDTEHLKHA